MDKVWRIRFYGDTIGGVQGAGLRELIEKVAKKDMVGYVKNVKNEPIVELVCRPKTAIGDKEERQAIDDLRKAIESEIPFNPLIELSLTNPIVVEGPQTCFEDFKDFKLIREDDSTELVWAMQGAGKLLISQEKSRQVGLARGLIYELLANSKPGIQRLHTSALSQFLITCPTSNTRLVIALIQLQSKYEEFLDVKQAGVDTTDVHKQISNSCSNLIERIGKEFRLDWKTMIAESKTGE